MLEQTASSTIYRGGEGQSVFPVGFPFLENSHVEATARDAEGAAARLVAGVDYTVNRQSDGYGEVILLGQPLAEGSTLTLRRRVPLTQDILFHNQGPNSPAAMEEALDKLTMIGQQQAEDVARRLEAPDGADAGETMGFIMGAVEKVPALEASVAQTKQDVAGKAPIVHSHGLASVDGLQAALAGKATASHRHQAAEVEGLAQALSGKAEASHAHPIAAVAGLADALAGKVGDDDPRLSAATPASHAASHAVGGTDSLTPADIGCLPTPPGDGKSYLATGGGWLEYVASAGESGESGTLDHSQLVNRDAANQHPQSAIQNLATDLAEIRDAVGSVETALDSVAATVQAKADRTELPAPATPEAAGLLSAADKTKLDRLTDAPSDGKAYVRKDGAWAEQESAGDSGSAGAGCLAGEIRLLPFRSGELPDGWYFCNGDRFAVSSPQGEVLGGFSAAFKEDWNIVADAGAINLPNLFNGSDGYFFRPVDNATRLPGSRQDDAIRNITGSLLCQSGNTIGPVSQLAAGPGAVAGAFVRGADTKYAVGYSSAAGSELAFDASAVVPTASENRPRNVGMTPAIHLGV